MRSVPYLWAPADGPGRPLALITFVSPAALREWLAAHPSVWRKLLDDQRKARRGGWPDNNRRWLPRMRHT